jgi:WD40 repeat protein
LALEHNPKIGVYLLTVNSEDQNRNDILFAQFNPKQRLLVTAGSHYVANIWDFRSDDFNNFAPFSSLPHIKGSHLAEITTDVSSVHWNGKGDRLVTSSSDMVARIWKLDVSDGTQIEIDNIKNFNMMLMNSKFNKGPANLVAAAGFKSGRITVWDIVQCKDVAKFDHSKLDPTFEGLEIEWQN